MKFITETSIAKYAIEVSITLSQPQTIQNYLFKSEKSKFNEILSIP